VIDAGGPVAGPTGGEVGATLEGVALDVETGGAVLGIGTERIAMPTGTVADELTEAGEPTAAGELTDVAKLTGAGEFTEAGGFTEAAGELT
jgi:uncharacterized protein YidB (DUF937 family)